MADYVRKSTVKEITATSRAAIKVKDNYYTVEHSETWTVPEDIGADIETERELLWDTVNGIVDNQCRDILDMYKK